MRNRNYVKGRAKEYRVMKKWKQEGCIVVRSAGSHSPIDLVVIDVNMQRIRLIQCKPKSMSENKKHTILEANKGYERAFYVSFEVV